MGKETNIEWADSTVNCSSGCQGCELWIRGKDESCYAGQIHSRFSPSKSYPGTFEQVSLHPGRMEQAAKWPDLRSVERPDKPWLSGKRRTIFVGDMGDIFSEDVPFEYLRDEVIGNIVSPFGRRHLWMILTKQPSRMARFSQWLLGQDIDWPTNIFSGTSVTTQATTTRVRDLCDVPGHLFVSAEPLRESVDLSKYAYALYMVIIGGESGTKPHFFDIKWARTLIAQCRREKTDVFVKQLGANTGLGLKSKKGGDWNEWPEDLRIRQFPWF